MNKLTPVQHLRAAKALIEDPAHWTQGAFARDSKGNAVSTYDETAVCWCVLGATGKISLDSGGPVGAYVEELWLAARPFRPNDVNDSCSHVGVMDMLDRAIALAEKEEK